MKLSAIQREMAVLRRNRDPKAGVAIGTDFEQAGNLSSLNDEFQAKFLNEFVLCLLADHQFEAAEKRIANAIEQFPHAPYLYASFIKSALEREDLAQAEARCVIMLSKFPDDAIAHHLHAKVALAEHNPALATSRILAYLKDHPKDSHFIKLYHHIVIDRAAQSDKRPRDMHSISALRKAGEVDTALDLANEAIDDLKKIIDLGCVSEHYPELLIERGHCWLRKHNEAQAERDYEEAIRCEPRNNVLHVAHNGCAQVALRRDDYATAEAHLLTAIELSPASPHHYALLAGLSMRSGNLAHYQAALDGLLGKCKPSAKNLEVIYNLIYALKESHPEQFRARKEQFESALAILEDTGQFSTEELMPLRNQHPQPITAEDLFQQMVRYSSSSAVFRGGHTRAVNTASAVAAFGEGRRLDGTPYASRDTLSGRTGGRN